eukprot:8308336-Alexandrium_andersonii.AAC.1
MASGASWLAQDPRATARPPCPRPSRVREIAVRSRATCSNKKWLQDRLRLPGTGESAGDARLRAAGFVLHKPLANIQGALIC